MTKKRLGSLIAFAILVAVLLGGGIYLRNFLHSQVRKRIQSAFSYSRIHLHAFPPSLVLEDVRTVSPSPFFSARSVSVVLPFRSLFKNEKPLAVFIDQPVIRIIGAPEGAERKEKPGLSLALPFAIERGLIRGGEFYFADGKESFQLRGLKASLALKDDAFQIRAEAAESSLLLEPGRKPLEGKLELWLESRGNRLRLNKFVLSGRDAWIKAKGSLLGRLDPQGTLQVSLRADMDSIAKILGIPFDWGGRVEGEGELSRTRDEIRFVGDLGSGRLSLNRVPLEKVQGRVEYSSERGVRVQMNLLKRSGAESVMIQAASGRVEGEVQGFHLEPILALSSLPWPVSSPAWGKFSLDDRELVADFDFRQTGSPVPPGKYPFTGPVHFSWDRKNEFRFSSPRLDSSFGRLDLDGRFVLGQAVDIAINGEVNDVKSAREFISLILRRDLSFPEIRGSGIASVTVGGALSDVRVGIKFALSPAGFDRYDVEAAEGLVNIQKNTVSGQFRVDDPNLRGEISLLNSPEGLDVGIELAEGDLERILSGLNLRLPLRGAGSGDFRIQLRDDVISVDGAFSSPLILFNTQELRAVTGKLTWDGTSIAFPELAFDIMGGRVKGSWRLGVKNEEMEIEAVGEKLDLSSLQPNLAGELSFTLKGGGRLGEDEIAAGGFIIDNLRWSPFPQISSRGDLRLRMSRERLGLSAKGHFSPGENDFSVDAEIPLVPGGLSIDIKGGFNNLDLLLPWRGAEGRVNYQVQIRGAPSSPRLNGVLEFQGPLLPFPQFPQAVTDYSGRINIEGGQFMIRSLKGKLGGGDIQGSGEVTLGRGGEVGINCAIEGKDLTLSPLERTRALTDASLRLIKDSRRFVLIGNFRVRRLSWRREIQEKFSFSSQPYPGARQKPGFFEDLTLDLRLKADDNAWMENSLGRFRGRFDLTITGNIKAPILLGTIETISGEAYFQDRRFQILRGRVSFFNPSLIEPYLDFRAETFVKDYRVTITLTGLARQLNPQFSSSPPLPPQDVLALLALGEAYRRQYRTETSSQLGTASLLSFTLTEAAQKRAEKLFSLDRFRIDPFLLGSSAEMTARLTIGKKISRDFFVYYSTNLTRQTEEIIRLEWDLSNEFSIVGTRNEIGRLSFDVKVRRRF
ncbi:MAG TPA: translocation/assembly module TamB domain-containing protein [Candidatus Desulfaltia sp.]|nr:translocation/assembly module TamB domain-containing protein [Candidatus Desulfaltia sp.]